MQFKRKMLMNKALAWILTIIMIFSGVIISENNAKASTNTDLTQYMSSDSLAGSVTVSPSATTAEINFSLPDSLNDYNEFLNVGINSMLVKLSVSQYTENSSAGTAGVQGFIVSGENAAYNGWQNLTTGGEITVTLDITKLNWSSGSTVSKIGIQFANVTGGSTVAYSISSITLSGTGDSSGSGSTGGGSGTTLTGSETSTNSSNDLVVASITEEKHDDWWYEYNVTITNKTSSSICGWVIKTNYTNTASIDSSNMYGCSVQYIDGFLCIVGSNDGSVISSTSTNSVVIKFGLGSSLGLSTANITAITYNYGSEVNTGTSDFECNYTLTGATKSLATSETPYGKHGALHVDGVHIYDAHGEQFQLRGVSLHGLQWDVGYNYINKGAFQSLRDEWGVNAIRLPVYVTQDGYTMGSASAMDTRIQNAVNYATELGMYVLIDWHVHSETGGTTNPNTWMNEAKSFFEKYASMYQSYGNVLFEICNEPVNTVWYDGSGNDLYSYANTIIPIIRQYTDAIVVVGTNTWSQDVDLVVGHTLNTTNTMYTVHFYSATHTDSKRSKVKTAIDSGVPVFCTEFGVCSADGNGSYNLDEADKWMELFDEYGISCFCWHLSNKDEKSAYLNAGCSKTTGGWINSDLSTTGLWLVNTYRSREEAESGSDDSGGNGSGDDKTTTEAPATTETPISSSEDKTTTEAPATTETPISSSEDKTTTEAPATTETPISSSEDKTTTEAPTTAIPVTTEAPAIQTPAKKGEKVTDTKTKASYTVTKSAKTNGTVTYTKPASSKATSISVPSTITINGITYKVTAIAANAFKNNKNITTVTIGSNVTTIGSNAFSGCTKLTKVTIGKNVKTIGTSAFSGCSKLKTVSMGANVTTIKSKAFYKCTSLTKITVPSKVTSIESSAFSGCTKLTTVTIGKKVKTIGTSAFSGCSKLKTVNMGANVTTIGDKAFYKCTALTKITIPSKVSKIGKQTFYGCKNLKTVTIKTTKLTSSKVGNQAFKGIYTKATIKVPSAKLTSYKKILKAKGVGSKATIKK